MYEYLETRIFSDFDYSGILKQAPEITVLQSDTDMSILNYSDQINQIIVINTEIRFILVGIFLLMFINFFLYLFNWVLGKN